MNTAEPVLIVGAGPAGSVLALALRKNGIPVRIIEKATAFWIGARGNGIQPRSKEVLSFLGVLPDIQKEGVLLVPANMYGADGQVFKTYDFIEVEDDSPACPHAMPTMLAQSSTLSILRNHLATLGTSVELGTELVGFEQDDSGVTARVLKRSTSDSEPTEEVIRASWLVGTDGARGIVRRTLGLPFLGEVPDPDPWLVGDVVLEGLDRKHWHMFGDPQKAILAIAPIPPAPNFQIIGMGPKFENPESISAQVEDIQELVQSMTKRSDLIVKKVIGVSTYRPRLKMVDTFKVGRVFLAGDAAHIHPPTGGQGMNTSIIDVYNLAWKLALVCQGRSPTSLLDSYQTERLPVVAKMLELTGSIMDRTAGAKADKLEDADTQKDSAFRRGRATAQLGVNYRWSPIVLDERRQASTVERDPYGLKGTQLRAGDRAPSASGLVSSVKGDIILFDLFGPSWHTVLVFPGSDQSDLPLSLTVDPKVKALMELDILRLHVILPVPMTTNDTALSIIVDREGHAHRGYEIEKAEAMVMVVRPDGILGAAVYGLDGLRKYLDTILI